MPIPSTDDIQLPLMRILQDGKAHTLRETLESLTIHFNLTEEEKNELIPSGKKKRFENRLLWAVTQLRYAHFLENVDRGVFKITQRGLDELSKKPIKIDNHLLKKFPEYREFLGIGIEKEKRKQETSLEIPKETLDESTGESPEEVIGKSYTILKKDSIARLLNRIKSCPPEYFERVVTELLEKMNY